MIESMDLESQLSKEQCCKNRNYFTELKFNWFAITKSHGKALQFDFPWPSFKISSRPCRQQKSLFPLKFGNCHSPHWQMDKPAMTAKKMKWYGKSDFHRSQIGETMDTLNRFWLGKLERRKGPYLDCPQLQLLNHFVACAKRLTITFILR